MSPSTLPIGPDKPWLAPLAGYSDLPFRLLCRHYGAAVCETEMVSAKGLLHASPGTEELLQTVPQDAPLVVQLFGAQPDDLGSAVDHLQRQGFSWFDLNVGCAVHKVLRQGAGCAMLSDTHNLLRVAKAMLRAAGHGHVGFKLRLGMDDTHPVLPDLALRLQDLGAGWITLHPRTGRDGFGGTARWDALRDLAMRLDIPLLASGDLFSAADGVRCLRETGVEGVMYARGAMHDPAIFQEHICLLSGSALPRHHAQVTSLIQRHIRLIRRYLPDAKSVWKMRSVIPRYVRGLPGARNLRQELCRCTNWEDIEVLLQKLAQW